MTLVTADGTKRAPAGAVRGKDLIEIALGSVAEQMAELAASRHLEIRTEGTVVRLPLGRLSPALPPFLACLASIGQLVEPQIHAAVRQLT